MTEPLAVTESASSPARQSRGNERRRTPRTGVENVKLIVEPDDGLAPLLSGIKQAKTSVEIVIFRLDRGELEAALRAAVARGVRVHALIACANRGGEKNLRKLEMRLLEGGIIVARSDDELGRYHDKLIIIDRRVLYVLSFNYTHLDIDHSRAFGLVARNPRLVHEAAKLFEADCSRRPYTAGIDAFVVSPANSRKVLSSFLKRAKKQLLIYDPNISDEEMVGILEDRAKSGVEIRIVGQVDESASLRAQQLTQLRLHTRTIIRDQRQAFVGSQSLRAAELDSRREVGLIVREAEVVKKLTEIFESDWVGAARDQDISGEEPPAALKRETDKAVEVLIKELHPLATTVKRAVRKAVAIAGEEVLEDPTVKDTVKEVVKTVVKRTVNEAVEEAKKP